MTVKSLIKLLWEFDPEDLVFVDNDGIIVHETNFDIDSKIKLDKSDEDVDEQHYY